MIFSSPLFLYLLPAAGLPILFHFLLKQKKRQILFPTLMFFYQTDPRLNARRKLHQWLLLLMRVLLITFTLLALARPRFHSAVPLGGKIPLVVVVDNSGSMSDGAGHDQTKLELAVRGAKHLISSLDQQALMNVVTLVADPNIPVGHSLIRDKDLLITALGRITPTAATGNAGHALTQAFALLQADSGSGGEVHVFSDLQEAEWLDDDLRLEVSDPGIRVYLHRIATRTREQANVAISSVQFPAQIILPKHPLTIGVVCRNTSQVRANIRVNSIDDQDIKLTQHRIIEPGGTQMVEVSTNPDKPGYHWMRTWIEGDGFSADNEAGIGILCRETATVAFHGARGEFGVLPAAFAPDDYGQFTGMVARFGRITVTQAGEERPILIVTTWQDIQPTGNAAPAIRAYVESGGNLLVVPGLRAVNTNAPSPAWLGAQPRPRVSFARGARLEALDTESDFWRRIRTSTGGVLLDNARAFTFYPLQLTGGFTPLVGTSQDQIILAHKQLGSGSIYASGTAFDPRWNTLPLTGLMVVMAQNMAVQAGTEEQDSMLSLVAGDAQAGLNVGTHEVEVHALIGHPLAWRGPASDMPVFTQPGAFRVKKGDRHYAVSVCSSPQEGLMQFVDSTRVSTLNGVTHEVENFDPTAGFEKYHHDQRRTFDLFLPLILLATVALLVEGWLANPVRTGPKGVTPSHGISAHTHGKSVHTPYEPLGQPVAAGRGDG